MFYGVDQLAEKKIWLTPYHYCSNNPIIRIDPTGALDGEYYDSVSGEKVFDDGKNDNKVYVRKTLHQGPKGKQIKTEDTYIGKKDEITDLTDVFNKTLENTEAFFNNQNEKFKNKENQIEGGWGEKYKKRLDYFKGQVGYNMDYDIKNDKNSPFYAGIENENFLNNYAFYDGKLLRSDDFGNFNYGVAGKAFGFGDFVLKAAAGYAQLTHEGSPVGPVTSFFDDPRDTYMISQGINYWTKYFKK